MKAHRYANVTCHITIWSTLKSQGWRIFSSASSMGTKYYAVAKGRKSGIYSDWASCKENVDRFAGAKFKSFATRAEAQAYIRDNAKSSSAGSYSVSKPRHYSTRSAPKKESPTKSPKEESGERETIYTDGATRNNGRKGAVGGYGVYYGENDPRNLSRGLHEVDGKGVAATNQRAELHALDHALRNVRQDLAAGKVKHYTIYSDSMYGKQCIEKWSKNWEKNGWKSSTGAAVANRDIIERAVANYKEINRILESHGQGKIEIEHVRGHQGNAGNEAADRLANEGADKMTLFQ